MKYLKTYNESLSEHIDGAKASSELIELNNNIILPNSETEEENDSVKRRDEILKNLKKTIKRNTADNPADQAI